MAFSTVTTAASVAAPVVPTLPVAQSASDAATRVTQSTPQWQLTRGQMMALAGVVVLVIATVAVPQQPTSRDTAHPQQQEELREGAAEVISHRSPTIATPVPAPLAPAVAPRPVVNVGGLPEKPKKSPARNATNRTAASEKPVSPVYAAMNEGLVEKDSTTKPAVPEPIAAAPSSPSAATLGSPVTITGCLEISIDGNEFRLADSEGADAPKSRSWRTGFLRKRTAPVALVGAPDSLEMKKSVGKRVAATGLLTGRELQLSALRVLGSSCN